MGISPSIWERDFCQSVRAQAHMEVILLRSQQQGGLGSQGTDSSAVPNYIAQIKWIDSYLW